MANDPAGPTSIALDRDEVAVLRFALTYLSDYEALARNRVNLPVLLSPAGILDAARRILQKLPEE